MSLDPDDRQAILDLYARYAHAIDGGDATACAACFALGGSLQVGRRPGPVGREAIAEFAQQWRASLTVVPRHVSWHVLLEEAHDGVRGAASSALLHTDAEGVVTIAFTARYDDRFVRDGDGWAIQTRAVTVDRVGG